MNACECAFCLRNERVPALRTLARKLDRALVAFAASEDAAAQWYLTYGGESAATIAYPEASAQIEARRCRAQNAVDVARLDYAHGQLHAQCTAPHYHVVAINERTGRVVRLSARPMPHRDAATMLAKFFPAPANRPRYVRYQLAEIGSTIEANAEV